MQNLRRPEQSRSIAETLSRQCDAGMERKKTHDFFFLMAWCLLIARKQSMCNKKIEVPDVRLLWVSIASFNCISFNQQFNDVVRACHWRERNLVCECCSQCRNTSVYFRLI